MLGKKGLLAVVLLFVAMVFLTGQARLALDAIVAPFRDQFREMQYMPKGAPLKIMAAGFDSPLADALFIKGMVYYPQALQHQQQSKDDVNYYTFELFDVITDLSRRFDRAYQVGGIFLSSSRSLEANRQGVVLLQKGLNVFDALVEDGEQLYNDPRWLFSSMIASIYDTNIQSHLRAAGDLEGASEARAEAAKYFRLGAAMPGAPATMIDAAINYGNVVAGEGDIERLTLSSLAVNRELYEQATARGDEEMAGNLLQRIEAAQLELERISQTKGLEIFLNEVGAEYLRTKGHAAQDIDALVEAGYLRSAIPAYPFDTESEKDYMVALPDGTFKSALLARREADSHVDLLFDSVINYRKGSTKLPERLEDLVTANVLQKIPVPPFAALGQVYHYDPASGLVEVRLSRGPLADLSREHVED